jgi:hypothetical protein
MASYVDTVEVYFPSGTMIGSPGEPVVSFWVYHQTAEQRPVIANLPGGRQRVFNDLSVALAAVRMDRKTFGALRSRTIKTDQRPCLSCRRAVCLDGFPIEHAPGCAERE